MAKGIRFTDEFKQDAVAQIVDRGYAVSEVAKRLGISTKSLYTWRAQLSKPAKVLSDEAALAAELRQVRKELARVTEERDILKKATAHRPAGEWNIHREGTLLASPGEVRFYRGSSDTVFRAVDVPCPDGAFQRFLRMA